jgi:hypothetical protein
MRTRTTLNASAVHAVAAPLGWRTGSGQGAQLAYAQDKQGQAPPKGGAGLSPILPPPAVPSIRKIEINLAPERLGGRGPGTAEESEHVVPPGGVKGRWSHPPTSCRRSGKDGHVLGRPGGRFQPRPEGASKDMTTVPQVFDL